MESRFPFDFNKHFVPDTSSPDCLPACFAMSARYWKDIRPQLSVPLALEDWVAYVGKANASSLKGVSTLKLVANLSKKEENIVLNEESGEDFALEVMEKKRPPVALTVQTYNLYSVEETIQFMRHSPPVPIILCFDQSLALNNQAGGGHAVLLYSVDIKMEKKVYVIDPFRAKLRKPIPWDLEFFNTGWKEMQNLAFAVYPSDEKIIIYSGKHKTISPTLLDYPLEDAS